MISSLTGTVIAKSLTSVVIDVAGIGFECGISSATASALPPSNSASTCTLYTRLQVRDDTMALYGFATTEERMVFDKLITVSGVGPKLALAILSMFSCDVLQEIISSGDEKRMTQVPGVGKKTAGRMILELKDAFKSFPQVRGTSSAHPDLRSSNSAVEESTVALLSMGFSAAECELALKGYEGQDTSEAVRYALKRLGSSL